MQLEFLETIAFLKHRRAIVSIQFLPLLLSLFFTLLFIYLFLVKKNTKISRKENGTKMKHSQMVVPKQTPLWLFWDI